jgi:hypothetical protein
MAKKSRQRRAPVKVGEIRRLSRMQCTEREAAAMLGIKLDTFREMVRIDERAKAAWDEGREQGKVSIRKAQFALAERNPAMAIYLGKVILNQREVTTVEMTGRDGGPIKTLDLGRLDQKGRDAFRELLRTTRVEKK